jgi:hypothetical protein
VGRVACLLALSAMGACGGGGTTSQADLATTLVPTSTLPATTTTLSPAELAKKKAASIVLVAADVPGFTKAAPTPDDTSPSALDRCEKLTPALNSLDTDPNKVTGDSFERADGSVSVESDALVIDDLARAKKAVDELSTSQVARCLESGMKLDVAKGLAPGTTVTVKAAPFKPTVPGAEQVGGLTLTLNVKTPQGAVPFVYSAVQLRKAGVLASVFYGGPTMFAESAELSRLLALVASRM